MVNCVQQHCTASIFMAGEKKKEQKNLTCIQVKLRRELPVGRQNIITS